MADDANITQGGIGVLGSLLYISEYLSESNNIHTTLYRKTSFQCKEKKGAGIFFRRGSQIYWGVINFWKEKSGGS